MPLQGVFNKRDAAVQKEAILPLGHRLAVCIITVVVAPIH
jgi:hypothetical protein